MNTLSRQAAVGALVAMVLALGANAGPRESVQPRVPSYGAVNLGTQALLSGHAATVAVRGLEHRLQLTLHRRAADLAEAFPTCRDKVLDAAFDAFGELAARLKQL